MANIKSAKKRAKQTVVRNARNVAQRSMLRTAVKKVIKALDANDAAGAEAAFAVAQPILDRFSARGLIHKNKAARHNCERLQFLVNVGLDYLTLDRSAETLSGGEAQRIRLASQIGAGLVGVMYILDEPSIGLHQRDNDRLLATLNHLRDLGNTVIVVEHDEDAIRLADYVVDIGPGAGVHGGKIVAEGSPEEVMAHPDSLTGNTCPGARKSSCRPSAPPATRSLPSSSKAPVGTTCKTLISKCRSAC